ncbi:MAG: aspartate-semialdehyde dehydrogenase [Planctomycetota bacterium]|jgi:aspartate-semialdehyde dehydrogenase
MATVAVVGATGAVGREIVAVLEERRFEVRELRLLASGRSAGEVIRAFGTEHEVVPAGPAAFRGVDLALFSAGANVARALAPAARAAGALVVDNSSAFRLEPDCPLVIPELNGDALARHGGIVANPNCSAILLCMAVAPLHRAAGLRRAVVCTYQAVSGAGARAMEEMRRQEEAEVTGRAPEAEVFPAVIAHNVIPWVQALGEDGYSSEETKLRDETRRILGVSELPLTATCVRVPVWRAHAQAVHVELERPLTPAAAQAAYAGARGVEAAPDGLPTPREVSGSDEVFVGRLRLDRVFTTGLALWCVMDQLRKGAALNAVQIAERALQT